MPDQGNQAIAAKLREMADLLQVQQESGYRIAAYRRAAQAVAALAQPIEEIVRTKGLQGLVELPGIGRGIGAAIMEMVKTGRWTQLDRLSGTLEPDELFRTIPGVGPALAERFHEELHIETLEQLELAAEDGRLERLTGVGPRRALAIKGALAELLDHRRIRPLERTSIPEVGILLDVDREYLRKASAGTLRKIAPKRFNPGNESWLPVLHTQRGKWHFTVLFSNTQRAHELGKTGDWVVIYHHADGEPEAQCTVVSETRGPLEGRRVVRGREGDCVAYYAETTGDVQT